MTDSARSDQDHRKIYQQFVDNYFSRSHLLNRAFSLKQEPSVVLRRISEEKIEIAFDEFEIEYGGRRESFYEELNLETTVNVQDIFMGRDCFHFALIGDSGQGKTCLLKHLCWKVNVQQAQLVNFLKEDPSTYYWNVEGLGENEPVPDPSQSYHLGLYLNAQDLWLALKDTADRSSPDAIFNALADAAVRTCRAVKSQQDRLDKSDNVVDYADKEFKESLLHLIKTSRLILLVDGLEDVRTISRSPLLYFLLNIKTKLPLLFRVIMACRPVTLFRQNPPEDFIYLYMHSVASMTEKEREPLLENILTRVIRDPSEAKETQPPLTPRSRSGSDQNAIEHHSPPHDSLLSTSEINKVFDPRRPLRRQKILRYLSSPAMMAILASMHANNIEISSCLYQFYQQILQLHDDVSASLPPVSILPSTTLYDLEVTIDERLMQKLCALVGFMYQCLLPYTWLSDFSIAKEVVKLLQIIVKNHHMTIAQQSKTEASEQVADPAHITIAVEWHPLLQAFAAHDVLKSHDKAARFIWDRVITRLVSSGVCKCHTLDDEVEITFVDSSLAQFLSANFLSDDEFSRPILHCFEQIYHNPHIPPIFLWQEENYITTKNWTLVYEIMTSRKGFLWIANKVLDPSYKSLLEWLTDITRNGGYDTDDLGLIRFNLLLKMFALQEEERLLLKQPSPEVKIDNHTLIVELKEQFGLAFLSVLNDSSSAVALIEPAPACSLSCFSKNVINNILDKCVDLLRRSNAFIITDLLLRFADYGHITDGVLGKIITIVTEEISRNQSKRPALKFLANYDQKFFDKRQRHIGLIISSLGALIEKDLDSETIEEAAHALTQLANRSLEAIKAEKKQREAIIPTNAAPDIRDHLPMLFTEEEWCMIVNSAITLLIDLVDMDFHLNMNNSKEIANEFEQKCRLFQCQNLPMIISFFEEPSCSARLMGFALLGTTKKSNVVDRDSEDKEIGAQLTILKLIAPHYSSDRALSLDITTDDPVVQCVSMVLMETLGEAASILVPDVQDLIKSKLDLLTQITKWLWRRLAPEHREKVFAECSKNANRFVRRDVIRLSANDEYILRENLTQGEIAAVFEAMWNYREEPIVHKECFTFFGNLGKYASKVEQKEKCMELIGKLLDKYGLANYLFSDSLLRITSELVEANKDNEPHKAVIMEVITKRNIKKMITTFLSGPMSAAKRKLWFGNVLGIELLAQLIAIDTEEIKEFLGYLNSKFPELRRAAVEVLKRARSAQVFQIINKCVEMMMKEEDYFAQRSIVVLLGILGRRKKADIQQRVVDEMLKILELAKEPLKQEIALSVIMTIGPIISSNMAIRTKLLQILSDANPQSFAAMNKISVAYKNKIKLTLTCLQTVQTLRIFEHDFVKHFFEMTEVPDMELRTALMVALNNISKNVTADELKRHEPIVEKLMKSGDPYLRELGLKVIRLFGPASIKRLITPLLALLDDTEHFCRLQGLKTLMLLIKSELSIAQKEEKERQLLSTSPQQLSMTPPSPSPSPSSSPSSSHIGTISINNINTNNAPNVIHPAKLAALQYLPPVLKRLADISPLVVVKALKIISLFRRSPKDKMPSPRPAEKVIEPEILDNDTDDDGDFERPTDEDVFYSTYVVEPNVERIIKPLYRRRFVNSIEVKIGVLDVLGTTPHLHSHLGALNSILNTENVTTLVEFSDTMRSEGVQILQYIPSFIQSIKAGSPLIRHLVRLAQHYERELTPVRCDSLFHVQSVFQLLKHKEPNVRRLAIHLLGKKCELKPKFIPTLAQMWEDKNTKVRKEVIEVLGDVGKRHPSFIPLILQSIDVDSSNSLMVWRSLSLSWGMLIGSNANSDNEELDDSSS